MVGTRQGDGESLGGAEGKIEDIPDEPDDVEDAQHPQGGH